MNRYKLPRLAFNYDAFEPYIDAKTMEIHYNGHHKAYVDKLNETLEEYPSLRKRVEELLGGIDTLPPEIKTEVKNNAGGHANHSLFWTLLSPTKQSLPEGSLSECIDQHFTTFTHFQDKFSATAVEHFSNGWAWLCVDSKKDLKVFATKDHESPITQGMTPLLVLDLWEHAYYLKYQNERADYVKAFWNIVNWEEVCCRWDEINMKGSTSREWRMAA